MRKRKVAKKASALAVALEKGRTVKGMKGFVSMNPDRDEDDQVFVKVVCLGLDASECGLQVLVKPLAGAGEFSITPCRWIDTPADIAAIRDISSRQRLAVEEFIEIYKKPHYHRLRVQKLDHYVANRMTASELTDFREHSKAMLTTDNVGKANSTDLRSLAKTAVLVVNKLTADQAPDDYDFKN